MSDQTNDTPQDEQERAEALQDQADAAAERVSALNDVHDSADAASPEDRGAEIRDAIVDEGLTADRKVVGAENTEVGAGEADLRDRFEEPEPLGQVTDQPESPNLGSRYVPGSANTTGETDVFDGSDGPPKRGE